MPKVKQKNNLIIWYSKRNGYTIKTIDGRCIEEKDTLEEAEKFCENADPKKY